MCFFSLIIYSWGPHRSWIIKRSTLNLPYTTYLHNRFCNIHEDVIIFFNSRETGNKSIFYLPAITIKKRNSHKPSFDAYFVVFFRHSKNMNCHFNTASRNSFYLFELYNGLFIPHDGFFPRPHLPLHFALIYVVVAEKVENRVDRQILNLSIETVAELRALGLAALEGDHHVPQHHGARVHVPLAGVGVKLAGGELV